MPQPILDELYTRVQKAMKPKRFHHCLGVMHTSVQLAARFGVDTRAAALAGLLHDYCKEWDREGQRRLLEEAGWDHCPLVPEESKLWHAWAGEVAVRREFGVEDEAILRAIRWHPTAHPDMEPLQAIVFLADYIEPGRNHRGSLDEIRRVARVDLDQAVYRTLVEKTAYIGRKGYGSAHGWSVAAREAWAKRVASADADAMTTPVKTPAS